MSYTLMRVTCIFFLVAYCSTTAFAQSTYREVYNLFQQHCTAACHSGPAPSAGLNLGASETEVYNALINTTPSNAYAANVLGQKLVDPGYPERSFLLRKCNNGFDTQLNLVNAAEGSSMPTGPVPLENYEIELIRQWILWGAQDTGIFVDPETIYAYYTAGGVADIDKPLTPEEEGNEGYQIRFGPIFMGPGEEFEYVQTYRVSNVQKKEVVGMKSVMHPYSHHWALRSLDPQAENEFGHGPLSAYAPAIQQSINEHGTFIGIWSYSRETNLPEGTAIFQDSAAVLLLNLHVANYNQDSIGKISVYQNIYTRPPGPGTIEMLAGTEQYGGDNPRLLQIPPDGMEHVLSFPFIVPDETYHLWALQGHTHSRGVDFDVFLRNPDGTKGEQIYEGFYDTEYTFNTGMYDFAHPPVRTWDDLFEVNMNWGLLVEGKFINNTDDTIGFGLTIADEMNTLYYLYTKELPTVTVEETHLSEVSLRVFPNPSEDRVTIVMNDQTKLVDAKCLIYDLSGKLVRQESGLTGNRITLHRNELHSGIYHFIIIQKNGSITGRGKWVLQ